MDRKDVLMIRCVLQFNALTTLTWTSAANHFAIARGLKEGRVEASETFSPRLVFSSGMGPQSFTGNPKRKESSPALATTQHEARRPTPNSTEMNHDPTR